MPNNRGGVVTDVSLSAKVESLLKQACKELGVEEICYCYDIQQPTDWHRRMKSFEQLIRHFTKRRHLFASSARGLSLWRKKVFFLKNMEWVVGELFRNPVCVWPQRTLPPGMQRYLKKQQIEGLVTVSISCPISPRLAGRFNLMAQSPEQLADLLGRMDEVKRYLTRLQTEIALNHGREINPLVDYNIVSPLAAYILANLAEGRGREEISSRLNLTSRGVDYHISALKQTLSARNIAQLMHKAAKHRLL